MSLFVHPQPSSSDKKGAQPLSRPGFADALGDRHLSVDNTVGTTVEILKFKKELGDATAFEAALRQRVDVLRRLLHPSLPTLRGVDRLPDGHLALISDHVPGRRLSEILQTARGPVFAVELIRQLTPALANIQRPDPTLSHGLITADRVIVTREGRLVVVEHALGSAVESLKLPAARLRSQFGLALVDTGAPVRLDQRMDVIQLGFVALTLLLGRRLDPGAFRVGIPALLDEFSQSSPRDAAALRPWFERALQIAERPFETAEDALDAIEELPDNDELAPKGPPRSILMFRAPAGEPATGPRPVPAPDRPGPDHGGAVPDAGTPPEAPHDVTEPSNEISEITDESDSDPHDETAEETTEEMANNARSSRKLMWIAAGFALLSAAEAAVIASLVLYRPSGIIPTAEAAPLETTASAVVPGVDLAGGTSPIAPVTPTAAAPPPLPAPARTPPPEPEPAAPPPPVAGRIGGARITAPVDLQVYKDGALLGTTAGPIALDEGSHTLDLVNETLGYRTRQTVAVKAGQLTAVRVTVPQGRININATPWANVWIDGTAAGETPIANLSLPIGNHEIVFRHPQLGEQRTTATVRAEGIARISASFQR